LLRGELLHCAGAYRGSAEANMRFLNEALQSLLGVWGRDRVGVCLSPERPESGRLFGKHDAMAFHALLLGALHREGIAYLHLVEPGFDGLMQAPGRAQQPRVAALLRPFYPGVLVAAGGFDLPAATAALQAGLADAVAFGRGFVANPDLPLRLRSGAVLAVADPRWFYEGGAQGYVERTDDPHPAQR
jgi:N-ethylmaleimide reductase